VEEVTVVVCPTCSFDGYRPSTVSLRNWSDPKAWPDNHLPLDGENATIMSNISMIMDIAATPKLKNLKIEGNLTILNDAGDKTITAENIHVGIFGNFTVGNGSGAYTGKLNIILTGTRESPGLSFGNLNNNKALAVSGGLDFKSNIGSKTVHTRLIETANAGDTVIKVKAADGWAVGDTLNILPSDRSTLIGEERRIAAISGTTVTLNAALSSAHYGAADSTIEEFMGQRLDSRTVVTLVNRNIVITVQENEKEWGCMLWGLPIFNTKDKKTYIPRINMEGVQFTDCGQQGTTRGAIYLE
jgi:hypothetical protein